MNWISYDITVPGMNSVPGIADNCKFEKAVIFCVCDEIESASAAFYSLARKMCEVRGQESSPFWRPDSLFDVPDPAMILPASLIYGIMVTERRFYTGSRSLWDMNENALIFS